MKNKSTTFSWQQVLPTSYCITRFLKGLYARGVTGPGSLTLTPPPSPPPSLEIGRKVLDHRRQRRCKQLLLDLAKGKKCVFTPCVYTQYTENF